MKKYLIILTLFLFFGCGEPINKSLEANLTVMSSISLNEEVAGVSETILEGTHPLVLNFQSGESSDEPGRIVLEMADKRFVFGIPTEKLSQFVAENGFAGRLSAEDSGQPYDVKLIYTNKVANGPIQTDLLRNCRSVEPIHHPGPHSRRSAYYYYDRNVEDHFKIVFLQPGSPDEDAGVAAIEVVDQRVEVISLSDNCF